MSEPFLDFCNVRLVLESIGAGRDTKGTRFAFDESHCAEFHHAYARVLVDIGEIEKAKEQIRKAVELWLPIRLEIMQDALLKPLWDSMGTKLP